MDFNKWDEGAPDVDPRDPVALYETLDRQQTHVELRDAQRKVLEQWSTRRGAKDLVIKLATGTGKTTPGLLMLWSHMRETGKPGLYLSPNKQLVEQVIEEGRRCGIPCVPFTSDNRIPPEAHAADAVLVTTVKRLFNAKAKYVFGRDTPFEPCALLVDDAHAALEIAREAFTIKAPSDSPIYQRLFALFEGALKEQSVGSTASIKAGDPTRTLEVPYWIWVDQRHAVAKILAEAASSEINGAHFVWGLIADYVPGLRCVFSGTYIEIAPEVLPVEALPIYSTVPRRIFMSATISDEAALVRDLGCDPKAAESLIELPDAGGLGERMIVVPQLMDGGGATLTRDALMKVCARIAARTTVVVIAPSNYAAKQWQQVATQVVVEGVDIGEALEALRSGKPQLVVFANRYDGIDLPDDACRLLVLDGAPVTRSLFDSIDGKGTDSVSARRRAVIHRVEQGLGRAVRSRSDYAAVILWGSGLVELISHRGMRTGMTDETQLQIELGLDIAKRAKGDTDTRKTIVELVETCLRRDAGWKKVYAQKVKAARAPGDPAARKARVAFAAVERRAWQAYVDNRGSDAARMLIDYLDSVGSPEELQWWIFQRAAWYVRATDPPQSLEWQKAACERDRRALRPPQGTQYRKEAAKHASAAAAVLAWFTEFEYGNGALAALEEVRGQLVFATDASSERFEDGMYRLGKLLGLESSRPEDEYGTGPDALWLSGQFSLPIEAKNRVEATAATISKGAIEQLDQSIAWTRKVHPARSKLVPLIAHPVTRPAKDAIPPDGMRVFTPQKMAALLDAVGGFLAALIVIPATQRDAGRVQNLLDQHGLTLEQILASFTIKVK
jgi:hypothetical protein